MADKTQQIVLDALYRAATEPGGMPLFASKSAPGWFANNPAGKQAAQQCQQEGLLRVLRSETKGKSTSDIAALSDKGLDFLLRQMQPRQVLEAFIQSLEHRSTEIQHLVEVAQSSQQQIASLKDVAHHVLTELAERSQKPVRLPPGADEAANLALDAIEKWRASGSLEDLPLPRLYRQLAEAMPSLTIGLFHDALRQLKETDKIYLHPWTGPLYQAPEPAYAMLSGHDVAYYVSPRTARV